MVKIAPSLLSANFADLNSEIQSLKGASWLHYDVMDGHFVPNISFGYSILDDVRRVTDKFLDVHLMISNPRQYVDEFINAGADLITFHIEAMPSQETVHNMIKYIKNQNVKVGISIKPGTSVDAVVSYLDDIDVVLVMSVEPGFCGQKFNELAIKKIKQLKSFDKDFLIEVDGGINEVTGQLCKDAGADVLVAGSYVFNSDNRQEKIDSLL